MSWLWGLQQSHCHHAHAAPAAPSCPACAALAQRVASLEGRLQKYEQVVCKAESEFPHAVPAGHGVVCSGVAVDVKKEDTDTDNAQGLPVPWAWPTRPPSFTGLIKEEVVPAVNIEQAEHLDTGTAHHTEGKAAEGQASMAVDPGPTTSCIGVDGATVKSEGKSAVDEASVRARLSRVQSVIHRIALVETLTPSEELKYDKLLRLEMFLESQLSDFG